LPGTGRRSAGDHSLDRVLVMNVDREEVRLTPLARLMVRDEVLRLSLPRPIVDGCGGGNLVRPHGHLLEQ